METSVHIATIDALRDRIQRLEGGARHRRAVLPFGIKAIDERLPGGGFALGALHEVAGGGEGTGHGAAPAPFPPRDPARTPRRGLWGGNPQDPFPPTPAPTRPPP